MAKRVHDSDSEINSDEDESEALKVGRKYDGAAKYRVKYNPSWAKEYPIEAVANDRYSFHCIPCGKSVRCEHQGLRDAKVHCERDSHKRRNDCVKKAIQ